MRSGRPGPDATAREIYEDRAQRREEAMRRPDPAQTARTAGPVTTIRFEFPGRPAATGTFAPADAKSLLAGMEQLKGTT